MSKIQQLRNCRNLVDLANLIGAKPKSVAYILYKLPPSERYSEFQISKRGGGQRSICAPKPALKSIQRHLADLLQDCLEELEVKTPNRKRVSHGFHRGRSTLTNAHPHKRTLRIFNLDLSDFFGSLNFGRVRGFFLSNHAFRLQEPVATVIAQLACNNNCLPQGSPCSPVIANLITHSLDTHLAKLAKDGGARYSRYADDITFSSSRLRFPSTIAKRKWFRRGHWRPSGRLNNAIKRAGFNINPAKVRMEVRPNRQTVTGLVVNAKVNVPQSYYRETRAMCHRLFRSGYYTIPGLTDVDGSPLKITSIAQLEGRLAYIFFVRARLDRWRSIREIADKNDREAEYKNMREAFPPPEGLQKLFKAFLNYKFFVGNELPVIFTEGPTDIVYLTEAYRHNITAFPEVATIEDDKLKLSLKFHKSSFLMDVVRGPWSGYSPLIGLVGQYTQFMKAFTRQGPPQPVILLIDNDSGGKKVIDKANKVSGGTISLSSTPNWHHITDNLYLLRTPPTLGTPHTTDMEDLFSQNLRDEEYNGKKFDKSKDHGDPTAYGKLIFAHEIVKKRAKKADVAGLVPLLDGIKAICEDLTKRHAS